MSVWVVLVLTSGVTYNLYRLRVSGEDPVPPTALIAVGMPYIRYNWVH